MANELDIIHDNQRRILTGDTSLPRILIGGMNDSHFPNFHTQKLLELATVVSLTSIGSEQLRCDRIYVPPGQPFDLRHGFKPDFFWDGTVLGLHRIVKGLDTAPFPTLVGWVHAFKGKGRALGKCFDKVFVPHQEIAARLGFSYEPFCLSWGSFEDRMRVKSPEKDIDVCVSMQANPRSPVRSALVQAADELAQKHPEWAFVSKFGLEYQEYTDLLSRSKIVLQVGNWGLQTTYRVIEAAEAEAWVISLDETDPYETTLEDVVPGNLFDHLDSVEGLEQAISTRLKDRNLQAKAKELKLWLRKHLSYEVQMKRLIEIGMSTKPTERLKGNEWGLEVASMLFDGSPTGRSLTLMDHAEAITHDKNPERKALNLAMVEPGSAKGNALVDWANLMGGAHTNRIRVADALHKSFPKIPEPNLIHMNWKHTQVLEMKFKQQLAWDGPKQKTYEDAIWESMGI